ncbi:MAG TPA: VOC family protein [Modicisalibacter sp.]|nr:VOC family protein [Modicisalibacter sp.]
MQLNPYLFFNGQCEEAFKHYAQCLGGNLDALHSYDEAPAADDSPCNMPGKIMHARLSVGNWVLMGSDSSAEHFEQPQGFAVTANVDDPTEAERVFQGLAEGGTVRMPIEETFWAVRFGMLVDRFGIPWMVNCEKAE